MQKVCTIKPQFRQLAADVCNYQWP